MGNKTRGNKGGGHGNGKQRGRARETKEGEHNPGKQLGEGMGTGNKGEGHGRARATGNKESPREGMGNGKQREPMGNKTKGNKGGGHGQRETNGGGHGNGKQRVYSRWRKDTSTADTINELSFCMCLWYHLVGRKPDLLDDLVCPDGATEQHLASGRLC